MNHGVMRACRGARWVLVLSWLGLGCSGPVDASGELPASSAPQEPTSSPVVAGSWQATVSERVEAAQYRFEPENRAFRASSPAERLVTTFDDAGAHIASAESSLADAGEVTLSLSAWGRLGSERGVASAEPTLGACSNPARVDDSGECLKRLELVRTDVVEWWENTPAGLQQGFTVPSKPNGSGRVRLWVQVEGATARMADGGVVLERADGSSLSYDELSVVDADGAVLPAELTAEAGRIGIVFDDSAAHYPVTVDPVVATTWSITYGVDNAAYGAAVAGVGDVNGDGYDDMAVAAPHEGSENGKVYVYYGRSGGPSTTADWTRSGTAKGQFGAAVSGAGDVNGDGYSDLVIGEPLTTKGSVYVYYGSANGLSDNRKVINGTRSGGWFGAAVAGAGDVNGDHYSDLVVGAPLATNVLEAEGEAYLYLGGSGGISDVIAYSDRGGQVGIAFGRSVAGIGSYNGDSLSDVVVGSPYYNSGKGAVWIYKGQTVAGEPLKYVWGQSGTQTGEWYGESVAAVGDENGDGYADFVVGAPLYDSTDYVDTGRWAVYHGDGIFGKNRTFKEGFFGDQFYGRNLAGAGDLNGDGKGDFVRGGSGTFGAGVAFGQGAHRSGDWLATPVAAAFAASGAGDVNGDGFGDAIFGRLRNTTNNRGYAELQAGQGALPHPWEMVESDLLGSTASQFGTLVADAGDVNGDGYSDLLVGAYLFDDAQPGAGKVSLYFGGAEGLGTTVDATGSGGVVDAHLGWSAAAGDFNGDGFNDVAVGAADYTNGENGEGAVYLFMGNATGWTQVATPLQINQAGARFGYALAAGDVNGDGYADLAATAQLYDGDQVDEGRVFVYHGGANGLPTKANYTFEDTVAGAWFGSALSIGDITGDGRGDLVIGAKLFSNGESREGKIYSYHGTANGLVATDFHPESQRADCRFGSTLSLDADFNGDGKADLAVSAPRYSNGNTREGRVFVYMGAATGLSSASWFVEGESDGVELGLTLAAGDFEGDGYGDLSIGVPYGTWRSVDVFSGGPNGLPAKFTKEIRTQDFPNDLTFAEALAMTGDFNGDSQSDLVMGLRTKVNGFEVGAARVFRLELAGALPRAVRPGTKTVILPGGKSPTVNVDLRMVMRTPYGPGVRYKINAEVKPIGTPFDGKGLVRSAAYTANGADSIAITGLAAKTAYHYRLRLQYEPVMGYGPTHSRWYYGGVKGQAAGVHFRTP